MHARVAVGLPVTRALFMLAMMAFPMGKSTPSPLRIHVLMASKGWAYFSDTNLIYVATFLNNIMKKETGNFKIYKKT